jgi:hypothetical protein
MRPTHRHILELVLLLAVVRVGGIDLNNDASHRKTESLPLTFISGLGPH